MGWVDSIWGKRSDDPLGTLDPKLQEFLRKESPLRYDSKPSKHTGASSSDSNTDEPSSSSSSSSQEQQHDDAAAPPRQSLFPDGRYAHLWRSYTPLGEIEAASKSDSDKLTDVIAAFKERKKEIGRAALENCVEWQEAWVNCYATGTWAERGTMCSAAMRKYERCYDTNVRLLKALGFQSAYNRAPELEEDIQMQADALYARILRHEAAVEEAKAADRPPPVFDPSAAIRAEQAKIAARRRAAAAEAPLQTTTTTTTTEEEIEPNERLRGEWERRLAELPEKDRPAELEAMRADLQSRAKLARAAEAIWEAGRKKKKEEGKGDGQRGGMDEQRGEGEGKAKPKQDKMVWEQLLDRWKNS